MSVKTIAQNDSENLSQVLPLIRRLGPLDKLRLIRILAEDLEPYEMGLAQEANEKDWTFEEEMEAWDLLSDEALVMFESMLEETTK